MQNDLDGLLALAKMPLLLYLIPIAYPNGLESKAKHFNSPAELEVYQEKCRKDLFEAYIRLRLEQPHDYQGYDPKDSKRWLIWLSKNLKKQNKTEFYLEKVYPVFFSSKLDELVYKLIIGSIIGLLHGLLIGLITGLIIGLMIIGLIVEIPSGLTSNPIALADKLNIDWAGKTTRKHIILGLVSWLAIGLMFWLNKLMLLLIIALLSGLFLGVIFQVTINNKIKTRNKPNQDILEAAKVTGFNSLVILSFSMLLFYTVPLVVRGQTVRLLSTLIPGFSLALIFGVIFDGLPVIQHFVLLLILWKSGAIPWNYARFLSYANERRLIKQVGGRYRFIHDLLREHFAKM